MNIKDGQRLLRGASLVVEHMVRSKGPEAVERASRVAFHSQELIKAIFQFVSYKDRNNNDNNFDHGSVEVRDHNSVNNSSSDSSTRDRNVGNGTDDRIGDSNAFIATGVNINIDKNVTQTIESDSYNKNNIENNDVFQEPKSFPGEEKRSAEKLSPSLPPLRNPNSTSFKGYDPFGFRQISATSQKPNSEKGAISDSSEKPRASEAAVNGKVMRERQVPSTRISRIIGFGGMAASIGLSTMADNISRAISGRKDEPQGISEANAERLAEALCRLRGAALKLGQMLSIQDSDGMLPPTLARALERVRQSADYMPATQLQEQLSRQLGLEWRSKFKSFEDLPIAAASIGQVHRAVISLPSASDGGGVGSEEVSVAVKVQYPGVSDSIVSDLNNLKMVVTAANVLPKGLYVDEIIRVASTELVEECDYTLEASHQESYRQLVSSDQILSGHVSVPEVYRHLSTSKVLTTRFVPGIPVDQVQLLSQETRNAVARTILYLTIRELFTWRLMQTDPNFSNFLYDEPSQKLHLIDFGATRRYEKRFVDGYMKLVWAAANKDRDTLLQVSKELGFLTGDETAEMNHAHTEAGMVVGEPFLLSLNGNGECSPEEPFDFASSHLTQRIGSYGSTFMKHRLTPPPSEAYSLHRKLAGAFLLCIKLRAKIVCRDLLEKQYSEYDWS